MLIFFERRRVRTWVFSLRKVCSPLFFLRIFRLILAVGFSEWRTPNHIILGGLGSVHKSRYCEPFAVFWPKKQDDAFCEPIWSLTFDLTNGWRSIWWNLGPKSPVGLNEFTLIAMEQEEQLGKRTAGTEKKKAFTGSNKANDWFQIESLWFRIGGLKTQKFGEWYVSLKKLS